MRHTRWAGLWVILLVVLGCGGSGEKLVPVSGKITVQGKPLTTGIVGFLPDASRGNERGQSSVGQIQSDGTFILATGGKPGAPLGWYKVLVWATNDPSAGGNPWGPDGKMRHIDWLTHRKYTTAETSDLVVEVVEQPEPTRYEFNLVR